MSQSAAQIIRTTVHTVQGQNFIDVCHRLFVFSHDVWRSHVFSPWCTDLGWDKGCWYIAHFYSLDEPWNVPRHRLSLRHFKDKVGLLSVHCMNTNVFQHFYNFPLTGIWIQPKSLLKHFSQHNGDEDKLIVYPHIWCSPQTAPKLEADHSVNQPVTKPANRENLQHCHKVFIFTSLVIMSWTEGHSKRCSLKYAWQRPLTEGWLSKRLVDPFDTENACAVINYWRRPVRHVMVEPGPLIKD